MATATRLESLRGEYGAFLRSDVSYTGEGYGNPGSESYPSISAIATGNVIRYTSDEVMKT